MQLYFKEARTIVPLRNHFFSSFESALRQSVLNTNEHITFKQFSFCRFCLSFFRNVCYRNGACSIHSFQRRNKIKQNPQLSWFFSFVAIFERLEVFGSILIMYSRRLTCPILFRNGNVCWRTTQINKLPMADYFTYNINANK